MANQTFGKPADIPPELDRWNWGAFFLSWIWGIGNSTYIAFLALVPFVGLIMLFVLGARGSRWAWRNGTWRSVEHFRKTQRAWAIAGAVVWLGFIALIAGLVFSIPTILKNTDVYAMTMQAVEGDERVTDALGPTITSRFWLGGSVSVQGGGTGNASLSIPIKGEKGSGLAYSQAVRTNGVWDMRMLVVTVTGQTEPIVLINKDNATVPNSGLSL